MNTKPSNATYSVFILVLLCLVSVLFFYSPGTSDVDIWRVWAKNGQANGLIHGFAQNQADYPPLSSVILTTSVNIANLIGITYLFDGIKLSVVFFLFLTISIYWLLTKDILITLLMYAAVMLNSAALVYLDIYFAPFLILSLWALKKQRLLLFSITFSIACLIKWQPLIIAPFILVYLLSISKFSDWKHIPLKKILLRVVAPAAALILVVVAIFGFTPIWQAFKASTSHNFLSGNALNLNWIVTHFLRVLAPEQFGGLTYGQADYIVTESTSITMVPRILFILFYLITVVVFFLRETSYPNLLVFSIAGYLAYYTFNIGVHENHLFLTAILAVMLLFEKRETWLPIVLIILMNGINLYTFYGVTGTGLTFARAIGSKLDVALLLAFFNVAFFLFFWWTTVVKKDQAVLP